MCVQLARYCGILLKYPPANIRQEKLITVGGSRLHGQKSANMRAKIPPNCCIANGIEEEKQEKWGWGDG